MKKVLNKIERFLYCISGGLILSFFNFLVMIISFATIILIPLGLLSIKRFKYFYSKQDIEFTISYKKSPVFNTIYLIFGGGFIYLILKLISIILIISLIFYTPGIKMFKYSDMFLFPFGMEYKKKGEYFISTSKQAKEMNGKYVFFRLVNYPNMLVKDDGVISVYAKDILFEYKDRILNYYHKQIKRAKRRTITEIVVPLILIGILLTIGFLIKDINEGIILYIKHYPFVYAGYNLLFLIVRLILNLNYYRFSPLKMKFKDFNEYTILVDMKVYEYKENYINYDKLFNNLNIEHTKESVKEIEYDKN